MTDPFTISETSAVGSSQGAPACECLGYVRQAVTELERANAEREPLAIIEHVCAALASMSSAARVFPDIARVFPDGERVSATLIAPLAETICNIVGSKIEHESICTGLGAAANLLCYPSDGLHVDRQLEIALLQAELSAFRFRRVIAVRGHNLSRYITARQTWAAATTGPLQ